MKWYMEVLARKRNLKQPFKPVMENAREVLIKCKILMC